MLANPKTQAPGFYCMTLGDFDITTISTVRCRWRRKGIRLDPGELRSKPVVDGSGAPAALLAVHVSELRVGIASARCSVSGHGAFEGCEVGG